MDVLSSTVRRRRHAWLALLACALTAVACLSLPSHRRAEPSFPHRVHVVDNRLECVFCHAGVSTVERPALPPPELCATCHDRFDAAKAPARHVRAFFDSNSRYRSVAASGLTSEVLFSHRRHVAEARLPCDACHGDVARQEEVPVEPLATKSTCMDCHASRGLGNQCAQCHRDVDATWRPPSHAQGWACTHGDAARGQSGRSADRCALCHQDATGCTACHQRMAPASHDQTFRLRTHGLFASIDRSRCATCHRQDACQQCHEVTRPRSHRGGFGSPRQRHCTTCHFPLAESGCAVCHPATPSHTSTPLPANHVPSMNCRLCHGNGVALPHPDGGHVCTTCHR